MNRLHLTSCPFCGGHSLEHALTCTDHYASGETFEVMKCALCGMMLTQDAPAQHCMNRYYETPDYISHTDTRSGLMNRIYHPVRNIMLRRKAKLVMKVSHRCTGRLTDYGAGTGYFAHTMQNEGWKVTAIEKSAQARTFAQKRFAITMMPETRLDNLEPESADVVTLWHVMEHVEALDHLWQALHVHLAPQGVMIVAVPNPTSWDAQHYGPYWAAYDVPRHLWHFTPQVMHRLAERHGFCIEDIRPMPIDAFYISMLSEKYRGSRAPFVRGLCSGLRAWMAAIGHKERSSSLIYVFRKKQSEHEKE